MPAVKTLGIIFFIFVSFNVGASTPSPTPIVTTQLAALSDLHETLTYPARVESKVNAMIYAEGDGVISKILAPLGSVVHRRQKIAVIKHTDPVYQYAPMNLISSVDGVVSQVSVTEGGAVTKGQLIAAVTDPKQVRIVIEISAGDLAAIKKGLEGELILNGREGSAVPVKIVGISPFVDPATGTATCELEVGKATLNAQLPPGAVGQVSFKVNQRKSFVFPDHAIVYRGPETFVRVVQNGVAKKVIVALGRKERGQVEILKGLKAGDVVIERASGFIGDGEKVQVENGAQN